MASLEQESNPSIRFDISVVEDRLELVCSGPHQRSDVIIQIDAIFSRMQEHLGIRKCLVDVRAAKVSLGIMGEYVIGEYSAKKLAGLRIALLQAPGQIDKLLEDTAHNRGLRILIVDRHEAALEWLDK